MSLFPENDKARVKILTDEANELQLFVITVMAINAFSQETIDVFFDGDRNAAFAPDFFMMLKETRKHLPPMLKESLGGEEYEEGDLL